MISSKIKNHFIQKKVQKLRKTVGSSSKGNIKQTISSVGILTKEKFFTQFDLQKMVANELSLQNAKVYSYRNFEKKQEKSYKHFSEKEFNWKGNILEPSFQNFIEEPLDLLICYYSKPHSLLDYVSLLSRANFKVGFAGGHSQSYHLEIAVNPEEVKDFFSETKKYLNILNKL